MKRYKPLFEKKYTSSQLDLDHVYELFSQNYLKATGKTWSKDKFISRASAWEFYGDDNGYVAVRPQRSGLYKLVGVAGSPKSIMKGTKELLSMNLPVWGAVSKDLLPMTKKIGFISPPKMLIKMLIPLIPSGVFGGVKPKIEKDGGLTLEYKDVGKATKYFIGNKKYYSKLLDMFGDKIPGIVKSGIKKLIGK